MKRRHPLIQEGILPRGHRETNERVKNAQQQPKTYVPYKKRKTTGVDPKPHINWGGAHKRKSKVTLPKLKLKIDTAGD